MTHLLRIHIGPVQEFIAAARRSSDLWFGSRLLSELSKAAALGIAEVEPGGTQALIFPAPASPGDLQPDSDYAVINEIVAVVQGDPQTVARAARDKLDERLTTLINTIFTEELRGRLISWPDTLAQIEDLPEFYWVAVALEGDYRQARALADHLLAARKNTRDFDSVTWGAGRPKSSLDGARESVIAGSTQDTAQMYRRFRARKGEELSGVDLLKRMGGSGGDSHFPSTSHMAAMPLRATLAQAAGDPDAEHAFAAYLSTVPPEVRQQERVYHSLRLDLLDDLDGGLLFNSRLTDHLEGQALRTAEQALRAFYKEADIPDDPNPYYALLVGDGDFMGRTISKLADAPANRDFSQALAGFAGEAKRIVAEHDGAVVFAGGDDVLALLPLHTAIACGAELAETFRQQLQPFGAAGETPTFSAGIAIVHHLEPLEDALALARRAERAAKAMDDDKNALAVALDKRSGVPRLVVGHWGELDTRLHHLAAYYQLGLIPSRLAYQLLDTYHLLGGRDETADGQSLRPILAKEARRITGRKQSEGGQHSMDDSAKDLVLETVAAGTTTIPTVADELVIAKLLADVATLAGLDFPFPAQEVPQP